MMQGIFFSLFLLAAMALSISEHDAKKLLGELSSPCLSLTPSSPPLESLVEEHGWLEGEKLVVKPDVLLKRRGVSGLVGINLSLQEVQAFLKEKMGAMHAAGPVKGVLDRFIVEPFVAHAKEEEFYVAMKTERSFDEILLHSSGGIDVGDVEGKAKKIRVALNASDHDIMRNFEQAGVGDGFRPEAASKLPAFLLKLYKKFCQMQFSFLEINPVAFVGGEFFLLDAAAKLDHTAEIECRELWEQNIGRDIIYPTPFGRVLTPEELHIRNLDSKTGASLKLTVLNPKGRVWLMVAGGGASVVYADTVGDLGYASELANYGEYSGDPSEALTYEYCRTLLDLMTRKGTEREEGKVLLVGGSIANFTNVAETFRGIIRALREYKLLLLEFGVKIYVRRGGPNYLEGLKQLKQAGKELSLPVEVYGPETYITEIIGLSLGTCDTSVKGSTSPGHSMTAAATPDHSMTHSHQSPPRSTPFKAPSEGNALAGFSSSQVEAMQETAAKRMKCSPQRHIDGKLGEILEVMKSSSKAVVFGLQTRAVQEMLDFDHVCGKKEPSVAAIVYEFSSAHQRPFYFGSEEIFIPVYPSLEAAFEKSKGKVDIDILINFASMRSAAKVTENCILNFPQISTVAVIAEGIPERTTRNLIQLAKEKKVALIGPATVGGIKAGAFRIGNTGGRLENIMSSKLFRPGSCAFVTKSGGLLNEINNILRVFADGASEGVAIGGDRYPGTTLLQHLLRYENDPSVKLMVMVGEMGGGLEYEVAEALKMKLLKKPLIAWVCGTCATKLTTEVAFGHAGSWAGGAGEHAAAKNAALRKAGALVPSSFQEIGRLVQETYDGLVKEGTIMKFDEPEVPRVPMDYQWAKKLGLIRRPKNFVSTISDDRGEELVYAGFPISQVVEQGMGVGGVMSLLWFKRPLPEYCYRYLEMILMITADHGPAVAGAHNTIVTARAGKDLISSLVAGLLTIGPRFGGACDEAAKQFRNAFEKGTEPEAFVKKMRTENKLIMGIGHKIKSVHNPDRRVTLLKDFCLSHFPVTQVIRFAEGVEEVTTRKKDTLILNVDGLIGASFVDMLQGCGAFSAEEAREYIDIGCVNGMFVLGRSIGFIGHYLDQNRLKMGLYRHDADDISYVLPELD